MTICVERNIKMRVLEATGATITREQLIKHRDFVITAFGAKSGGNPCQNTEAINQAIQEAAKQGGGCVVIPAGVFSTYTIELLSNVNIRLEKEAVIKAARTDIQKAYEMQEGEGGNYLEPEINRYAGIQDHGHSYFKNSLFYAHKQENIMIYGEGLIDGSYYDEKTGFRRYTLMGGDPFEPEYRNEPGHREEWYGNKGIALVRCKNIVLADFSFVIGGHFAIIAEGTDNLLADHILVDTTRDAFDIDCCQDVTVINSVFNSLTDDALVVKASYGAGIFKPAKNILIEDCTVSGYDAGSVYAGLFSREKLIATDSCGPTGRVKLGTESTCGYEKVTVRRVHFKRSRGFALEAVDGSDLHDILFEDSTMEEISSSPIFIRAGDRGRFPVTGNSTEEHMVAKTGNVRIDNRNWILPDTEDYQKYPAKRYVPSYRQDCEVNMDGFSKFCIVNQSEPAYINEANSDAYHKQEKESAYCFANAVGSDHIAKVYNIVIRNIDIKNVDPRYPIIIMGLIDSKIENVEIENIKVSYRGGITMEQAVEQRQIYTNWEYTQYETAKSVQTLPWLVNPFFLKEEGLLPRVDWNSRENRWESDPYNVPELPRVYPEPSNWGILPAYGMYIRHANNVSLKNISLLTLSQDERNAICLDDVHRISMNSMKCSENESKKVVLVENHYKRKTNHEYLLEEPYFTTDVSEISTDMKEDEMQKVVVNAPAPGTPKDCLYEYATVASPETGYHYATDTLQYKLPLTVYRPYFQALPVQKVKRGEDVCFKVIVRDPASETTKKASEAFIYNESKNIEKCILNGMDRNLKIELVSDYEGTNYDVQTGEFKWETANLDCGLYEVMFQCNDGIECEYGCYRVQIEQ